MRRSSATKALNRTATPANETMVRTDAQPTSGASTTVNTASSIAAVIAVAPPRSNDRRGPRTRPASGTSRMAAIRVMSAMGAGTKNTHRQPSSVRTPPNTRPSENPVAPVAV